MSSATNGASSGSGLASASLTIACSRRWVAVTLRLKRGPSAQVLVSAMSSTSGLRAFLMMRTVPCCAQVAGSSRKR